MPGTDLPEWYPAIQGERYEELLTGPVRASGHRNKPLRSVVYLAYWANASDKPVMRFRRFWARLASFLTSTGNKRS